MLENFRGGTTKILSGMLVSFLLTNGIVFMLHHFLIANTIASWIIFKVGQLLVFIFFLLLGILFKRFIIDRYYKPQIKSHKIFICASGFSAILVLCVASNLPMADLHVLNWKSTLLFFFVACLGSLSFALWFILSNCSVPLLEYIGKHSLIINGTHLNLMIVPFSNIVLFRAIPYWVGIYNLGPVLVTFLVLAIESLFILPIVIKVFPFFFEWEEFQRVLKLRR